MKIFYRDDHIIVCIKPAGAISTDQPGGMPDLIRQKIGEDAVIRTVHRLDSIVSGLMVYALSKEAASRLSDQIEYGSFNKEYLAVTEGHPEKSKAELRDYLDRNKRDRKTYVSDRRNRNAKEAILRYQVCAKTRELSLVRVKLVTGRTHQIRCQFSSRKLPLYGDRQYGSAHGEERIALWSCHLSFEHPVTGETMEFSAMPPARVPWTFFKGYTEKYEEEDLVVEFKRSKTFSDCPYAEDCGFCSYQGMEVVKQLEKKQKRAGRWLGEYGTVEQILPMEQPFGYRNKTTWDIGKDRSGRLITGIYSRKGHRVYPVRSCRIDHPTLSAVMADLRTLLIRHQIEPYDEKESCGWIRRATLRISPSGQVMVILNAASESDPEVQLLAEELAATHSEVRSVLLEIGKTNSRAGRRQIVLWGADHLEDQWMGQWFQMDADSFFPLNPIQSEAVYQTAFAYAELTGEERILDAGCGVGILAMAAATKVKRVLAAEVSKYAVKEAEESARKAGIGNIKWINSEPELYLDALARSREQIDVLFFEASRCRNYDGCMAAVEKLAPRKIIYISGNSEAAGKDLKLLTGAGYTVEKIQPVDIMPFTEQIETIVRLSRG